MFFLAILRKSRIIPFTMAVKPHVTDLGTNLAFVRGGACGLYPIRTCVGGSVRRPTAARTTNRRVWQHLGVGDGELSLCRKAVPSVCGNQLQSRSWKPKAVYENNSIANAATVRWTLGLSWPTQGVDSETQEAAHQSRSLGFGEARGARYRGECRDLCREGHRVRAPHSQVAWLINLSPKPIYPANHPC